MTLFELINQNPVITIMFIYMFVVCVVDVFTRGK